MVSLMNIVNRIKVDNSVLNIHKSQMYYKRDFNKNILNIARENKYRLKRFFSALHIL